MIRLYRDGAFVCKSTVFNRKFMATLTLELIKSTETGDTLEIALSENDDQSIQIESDCILGSDANCKRFLELLFDMLKRGDS